MMQRATRPHTWRNALGRKSFAPLVMVGALSLAGWGLVSAHASATAQTKAGAQTPLVPLPKQLANVPFPTETWPKAAPPAPTQAVITKQFEQAFGTSDGPMGETRAVVIVHKGRVVAERYRKGFDAESKLISWSMAKSITAALVGIALGDGKLKLDDGLKEPLWSDNDPRRAITFRQALHMSDGLKWREEGYNDPIQNDAAKMLFGSGREDIVAYVAKKRREFPAGQNWRYSSGTTNLISAAVGRSVAPRSIRDPLGQEGLRSFMYDRLFRPLGMSDTAAEFDLAGNFYASSLVHATAQDYARFGLLHLRGGMWNGKRILPEGYVDFLRTPATAKGADAYGAHWWLSLPNKAGLLKDGPYDSFEAHGFQGQVILVIPSKDLVIVRLGLMRDEAGWEALGAWLQPIVTAFPSL